MVGRRSRKDSPNDAKNRENDSKATASAASEASSSSVGQNFRSNWPTTTKIPADILDSTLLRGDVLHPIIFVTTFFNKLISAFTSVLLTGFEILELDVQDLLDKNYDQFRLKAATALRNLLANEGTPKSR